MAAVAAHFTRVARVSTNSRVKYAQQYMNKPDQEQGQTPLDSIDSSRLCITMSQMQFDGYEWDVLDNELDNDVLARRLTRKLTALHADSKQGLGDETVSAQAPSSPSRNGGRPLIIARFDTEARSLMSPSRPGLFTRQRTNEQEVVVAKALGTLSVKQIEPLSAADLEPVHISKSVPKPVAVAVSEPGKQDVTTPLLTTRRFREGRSSFMSMSPAEQRIAEF
jgi:hypothetical protein